MLLNVVAMQVGWFAAVLGAANGHIWTGPIAIGLIVGWHAIRAVKPAAEWRLLGTATLIGFVFEAVLVSTGAVEHRPGTALIAGVPLWMITLWPLFATSVNVSLRWLRGRHALAAALGLIGGPLAYWGGERLGALMINGTSALAVIGVGWATLMPVLCSLGGRFDGFGPARPAKREAYDANA